MERVTITAEVDALAKAAVDAAFCVHKELGPGLLESAYESCFCRELELGGLKFRRQVIVPLHYRGAIVETGFRADVLLDEKLLVELKAVDEIIPLHKAQLITYLKIMNISLGLLINFNEVLIKNGITRVLNIPKT